MITCGIYKKENKIYHENFKADRALCATQHREKTQKKVNINVRKKDICILYSK